MLDNIYQLYDLHLILEWDSFRHQRTKREVEQSCDLTDPLTAHDLYNFVLTLAQSKASQSSPQIGPVIMELNIRKGQMLDSIVANMTEAEIRDQITDDDSLSGLYVSTVKTLSAKLSLTPDDFVNFAECQLTRDNLEKIFSDFIVRQSLERREWIDSTSNVLDNNILQGKVCLLQLFCKLHLC